MTPQDKIDFIKQLAEEVLQAENMDNTSRHEASQWLMRKSWNLENISSVCRVIITTDELTRIFSKGQLLVETYPLSDVYRNIEYIVGNAGLDLGELPKLRDLVKELGSVAWKFHPNNSSREPDTNNDFSFDHFKQEQDNEASTGGERTP